MPNIIMARIILMAWIVMTIPIWILPNQGAYISQKSVNKQGLARTNYGVTFRAVKAHFLPMDSVHHLFHKTRLADNIKI